MTQNKKICSISFTWQFVQMIAQFPKIPINHVDTVVERVYTLPAVLQRVLLHVAVFPILPQFR